MAGEATRASGRGRQMPRNADDAGRCRAPQQDACGAVHKRGKLVCVAIKIDITFYVLGIKSIIVYCAFIAISFRLHSITITHNI